MAALPDPLALGGLDLFHGLPADDLARLNDQLRRQSFRAGTPVVNEDQPGEAVYIVLDGSVKIQVAKSDGSEVILAILGRGELVGEMSVVDSLGRSASAVTLEPTTVLWMDRASFWDSL